MQFKDIYKSRKIKYAVGLIIFLGFILAIFQAGVFLGYHKAMFSSNLGDNYLKTFEGDTVSPSIGMMSPIRRSLPGGHGVVGTVIKSTPNSLVVAAPNNTEETIKINEDTLIRQYRDTSTSTDIEDGDDVVVVGFPNTRGEVEARLIRITKQKQKN